LIRSWRNRLAPVNQLPPEILTLIPDFWNKHYYGKGRDLVALTHVCQAWREVFISRSFLWTGLDYCNKDKNRVYLERSMPLPVNLWLYTDHLSPPDHTFFDTIPHAIGRLGSLIIDATPENLQDITDHLSRPAPLLEKLSVCGDPNDEPDRIPVLTPALFNGDLSSLRVLKLESVRTELPWRNMVNLTSFKLFYTSPGGVIASQLLDFFEGAPHLRKVILYNVTLTSGTQNNRLVSLACLEKMEVTDGSSASPLLDYLLIPVGTRLIIEVDLPNLRFDKHPPRFLDNLRNLLNFTTIELTNANDEPKPYIHFSGPNGQVKIIAGDDVSVVLEALDYFDTSKLEHLEIDSGESLSNDPPYRTLLPMEHLRTLTLRRFENLHIFIHALHHSMSPSGIMVCPKLAKLSIEHPEEEIDLKDVIGMAAARASRGAKLEFVSVTQGCYMRTDVLELKKHVLHVESDPGFDRVDDDSDDSHGGD
jgi:hypothetical protein